MSESIDKILKAQASEQDGLQTVINLMKDSVVVHWKQTHALTEQSKHLKRWGYVKLANILAEDAEQEHDHARILFERLEFYDNTGSVAVESVEWPRHDIKGIIQSNLDSDREASKVEKAGIIAARKIGDELTAQIFATLLAGSEAGITENTSSLKIISEMGIDNFLTLQV